MRNSRGAPSSCSAARDGTVCGQGAVIRTYRQDTPWPARLTVRGQEVTGRWRRCARSRAISESHAAALPAPGLKRSEEHTSELQSQSNLVCRLLLEKQNASLR